MELIPRSDGIREEIHVDNTTARVTIRKTQNCEPVLDAIRAIRDLAPVKNANHQYIGSIPIIVAAQWAKTCGAAVGTKEFMEYAKKQLMDSNYAYLRVRNF